MARHALRTLLGATYRSIYSLLPQRGKVFASELAFKSGNRPFVYQQKNGVQRLARGMVSFSIDFELAWAWRYAKGLKGSCVDVGLCEREQVPEILGRLNALQIPATWATVGHLFLERCERGRTGLAHETMPRPPFFENENWRFKSGDWYQHDPCTDVRSAPAWYAPDLIENVLASPVKHEIACHGFSHAGFGRYCPTDVAAAELDACIDAMKRFGIRPRTFVFPGNDPGHFEVIASRGFSAIRWFPVEWAEIALPLRRHDGLWAVHDSTAIDLEGEGWNLAERLKRLKKYVDKAATTGLAAHIWFHPSLPRQQMEGLLFPLLQYCAELRNKHMIDILTIEQLVAANTTAPVTEVST